ncbi:hypothetical protein FISHEDRAFT_71779 [Fistulina hepatica ATCC 64428]|uniref:LysM domain-containing protein n=1 Tax=Fistulina hepatica ATCC 64428 TaxID=1128425 RepID=A0A0D7AH39_9AGAR|nr:hypothetical protein FISHEDRAFT_71779 [Fistulina hepatica ATCC 64428]
MNSHQLIDDSPTYNPFVDTYSSQYASSASSVSSSASKIRRRKERAGSAVKCDGMTSSTSSHRRSPHRRSHTGSKSVSYHPLRGAKLDNGHVTRPHLRQLTDSFLVDIAPNERTGDTRFASSSGHEETLAIVHEVQKDDTFARVALRYGITISDLRRANQLWNNDPIHMRKMLYIPVHLASRVSATADPFPSSSLIDLSPPPSETADSLSDVNVGTESFLSHATIRRVPVSRLSFFPPPTGTSRSSKPRNDVPANHSHVRYQSAPLFSLSAPSLFSPLIPLPGRLSLDSSAKSTSTGSSERDEDSMEMNNVESLTARAQHSTFSREHLLTPATPRAPAHVSSSCTAIHDRRAAYVRTVQMAPEPGMILPQGVKSRARAASNASRPEHKADNVEYRNESMWNGRHSNAEQPQHIYHTSGRGARMSVWDIISGPTHNMEPELG